MIGIEMNEPSLRARLEGCLLTDDELAAGQDAWRAYVDPFESWAPPAA